MSHRSAALAGYLLAAAAFACAIPTFGQQRTAPSAPAVKAALPKYIPVPFAELPGWQLDDHAAALRTFIKSCQIIIAASKASDKGNAATSPELLSACDAALKLDPKLLPSAVAKSFFEGHFKPHRIEHSGPAGLLTGYYEPVIAGSRKPTAKFSTPIYMRPPDLMNLVEESQRGAKDGSLTHGRKTAAGVEPYATRAEIEQGSLNGKELELMYLADPVDAFFLQIQGSGRIKLPDGSMVRVSYDGKNGHPYTSIGRYLIDTGLFPADKMSLKSLGEWLKADSERGRSVMWQNKSYVFFRELKGKEAGSALGVLHIPLTTGRSLAVDASVHAIGTPVYVSAPTLAHATKSGGFHRLMVAQDVGSAIKGPERGDIYFGTGDAAGKLAGVTKHPGTFFVLLPGATAAKAIAADTKATTASAPPAPASSGSKPRAKP